VSSSPSQRIVVRNSSECIPFRAATAVLVGFDLDQRRLGGAVQARDGEAVRVGLLELVDRPVQDELAELLLGGVPAHVRRQPRTVIGVDHRSQLVRDRSIAGTDPAAGFQLLDEDGDPVPAPRRTIALCRCGRTGIPPFCDGTHTLPRRTPAG